jgi:deoxyribonuclease-4
MELDFVYGVKLKPERASKVAKIAAEHHVKLSAHGAYYINLNAAEPEKVDRSKQWILKAARIAHLCGATTVTFHAAFYMGQDPRQVYETTKRHLQEIVQVLRDEGNPIWVRPETTGKGTQFGTLDEILRLSVEIEGIAPCVDFAHIYARTGGEFNRYDGFNEILSKVEGAMGRPALDDMHIHVAGIEYGPRGERKHLKLPESDFRYQELLQALKDREVGGLVISESPEPEEDALLLKRTYAELGGA